MSERIRVLLADDHPIMTEGLKLTISAWSEFEVVGIATDGQRAVELCQSLSPDLVILDMQMPRLSGPEAIEQIRREHPNVRTVALTTFDDADTVAHAMEAGCNGFLLKVIAPEKLRASLLSIAGGMNVYDDEAMSHLKMNLSQRPEVDFSPRELEMLGYVCRGMTNAEIADRLNLRPGTVKNMISLLLNKTGCISRAQLARYAADNRLTD